VGAAGFLLLLAYIFSGQVRDAILGPVLRLETSVADALGIVVRRSSQGDTAVDPLAAAVVLALYTAASLYLAKRQSDVIPSADELLARQAIGADEMPTEITS
jgi:hypothetical protein